MCLPASVKLRHLISVPISLLAMQQNLLNPLISSLVKLKSLDDTVLNSLLVRTVVARSVLLVLSLAANCSQLIIDWGLLVTEHVTVTMVFSSTMSLSGSLVIVITGVTKKL